MTPDVLQPSAKFDAIDDYWNPRIIGRYGDSEVRLAKIHGAFDWHHHQDSDELFLVVKGAMRMEFRAGARDLTEGEIIIVPAGVEHRPVAEEECHILMLDKAGEPNTGVNASSTLTRTELEAI